MGDVSAALGSHSLGRDATRMPSGRARPQQFTEEWPTHSSLPSVEVGQRAPHLPGLGLHVCELGAGILEQALRKSATTLISSRARNETRFGHEVALSFKDTSATRCTNEELPES